MAATMSMPTLTEPAINKCETSKREWRFESYLMENQERSNGQGGLPSSMKNLQKRNNKLKCQTHTWCDCLCKRKFSSRVNCSTAYTNYEQYKLHSPRHHCTPKHEYNHFLMICWHLIQNTTDPPESKLWITFILHLHLQNANLKLKSLQQTFDLTSFTQHT